MALQNVMQGRPTGMQAKLLVERLKALKEGEVLEYSQIGTIIHVDKAQEEPRFWTVVNRARRDYFRELGRSVQALPGVGLRVDKGEQQLDLGKSKRKRATRSLARSVRIVAAIADERLTETQRQARDHLVNFNRELLAHAMNQARLKAPDAKPQLQLMPKQA